MTRRRPIPYDAGREDAGCRDRHLRRAGGRPGPGAAPRSRGSPATGRERLGQRDLPAGRGPGRPPAPARRRRRPARARAAVAAAAGPLLPVPIPVPVRPGAPDDTFPWPWSITPWFVGGPLAGQPAADRRPYARVLGRFLARLHTPAAPDPPRNPVRGIPLAGRSETPSLRQLETTALTRPTCCDGTLGPSLSTRRCGRVRRSGSTATRTRATCSSTTAPSRRSSTSVI